MAHERYSVLFAVATASCLFVLPAAAAPFTTIANSVADGLEFSSIAPSIADSGVLAFMGKNEPGCSPSCHLDNIYSGDGGPLRVVVDTNTGPFSETDLPLISDDGAHIAFFGAEKAGPRGIYRIDPNGFVTTIVNNPDRIWPGNIANDGTVIFAATIGGVEGYYTGDGGPLSTFVDENFLGGIDVFQFLSPRLTSINNVGTRAASIRDLGVPAASKAILTGPATGPNNLAVRDIADGITPLSTFSINDQDAVAFDGVTTAGTQGIFVSQGGSITAVADTTGPFGLFPDVSINDFGTIVFRGDTDVGGVSGLYKGPDPVKDKIIAVGDVLFGKTVLALTFGPQGLNFFDQIGFWARFSDATESIVRASVGGEFDLLVPRLPHGPAAQLSITEGARVALTQFVENPMTQIQLSFDLDFLTGTGLVTVMLGDMILGTIGPDHEGRVLFDVDLRPVIGVPPLLDELLLSFELSGPLGSAVRIDEIAGLPGLINGSFDIGYFDGWQIDTSEGGVAFVTMHDTAAASVGGERVPVSEPAALALFGVGLAGLGLMRRWRTA